MAVKNDWIIREALVEDLWELDRHEQYPGLSPCNHRALLEAENDTLLVAKIDGVLRRHVYIRWTGFETPAFAAAEPQTPVMNSLVIWPSSWRSQGIGTALVSEVERLIVSRGLNRVGIGLSVNNNDARRFYERLGFKEWNGEPVFIGDPNVPSLTMMAKKL